MQFFWPIQAAKGEIAFGQSLPCLGFRVVFFRAGLGRVRLGVIVEVYLWVSCVVCRFCLGFTLGWLVVFFFS